MRSLFGRMLQTLLRLIPLGFYRRLLRRDVIGVFYHAVSDEHMPHVAHLYPPVSTTRFRAALEYLKRSFNIIGYADLEQHRIHGTQLPDRALHLSFDDGFTECFTVVRPVLLELDIPCTFFVTSDWIDNGSMFYRNKVSLCIERLAQLPRDAARMAFTSLNHALDLSLGTAADFNAWIRELTRADEPVIDMAARMLGIDFGHYLAERKPYMDRRQISQMHAAGFTVGGHSRSHYKLARLSSQEMETEIVASCRVVQGITGAESIPFSFPNSATGVPRQTLAEIRQRHSFLGLFFDTMDLNQDLDFIVNRIWAEKRAFHAAGEHSNNMPVLLHAAYRDQAWKSVSGLLK